MTVRAEPAGEMIKDKKRKTECKTEKDKTSWSDEACAHASMQESKRD